MHNYKIDKSLDFLQKAVSNNSPLFKDIAFTFEGKKQYDKRHDLKQKDMNREINRTLKERQR